MLHSRLTMSKIYLIGMSTWRFKHPKKGSLLFPFRSVYEKKLVLKLQAWSICISDPRTEFVGFVPRTAFQQTLKTDPHYDGHVSTADRQSFVTDVEDQDQIETTELYQVRVCISKKLRHRRFSRSHQDSLDQTWGVSTVNQKLKRVIPRDRTANSSSQKRSSQTISENPKRPCRHFNHFLTRTRCMTGLRRVSVCALELMLQVEIQVPDLGSRGARRAQSSVTGLPVR
jgi:hypothetical protein